MLLVGWAWLICVSRLDAFGFGFTFLAAWFVLMQCCFLVGVFVCWSFVLGFLVLL